MDGISKVHHKSYLFKQNGTFTTRFGFDPPVTTNYDSRSSFDASDSSNGFKNPSWREQVRRGVNATTFFNGIAHSDDPGPYAQITLVDNSAFPNGDPFQSKNGFVEGNLTINDPPSLANPGSVVNRVTNRALSRFISSIDDATSSLELGQDLGEYKETLHGIHSPLSSLRDGMINYLSSLKKVKRSSKNRSSLKKILTDTYLEFHFGWQPLADDVAKLIADAGRYRFPQLPVYGSAHDTFQCDENVFTRGAAPLPNAYNFKSKVTQDYSVRYKGVVRTGSNASGQIGQLQAFQLTPERWLPTAWDLLPYSWIADYFTNIGEMLQGLAHMNVDLVWACMTSRHKATADVSDISYNYDLTPISPPFVQLSKSFNASGGSYSAHTVQINRTPIGSSDLVPRFEFRIPTGKYPFLNMGAILLQRSAGLRPFF
jgi:hypothetical protein